VIFEQQHTQSFSVASTSTTVRRRPPPNAQRTRDCVDEIDVPKQETGQLPHDRERPQSQILPQRFEASLMLQWRA